MKFAWKHSKSLDNSIDFVLLEEETVTLSHQASLSNRKDTSVSCPYLTRWATSKCLNSHVLNFQRNKSIE